MGLSEKNRRACLEGFAAGLGWEDIAVQNNLPGPDVRAYMLLLARGGVFDRIYARKP